MQAACVLYAMSALHPGVLDLVTLFVGAFEFFIGTGTHPKVAIQSTSIALAMSPSTVHEALR